MRRLASLALLAAVAAGAAPAHASGPLPPAYHCVRDVCVLLGVQVDGTAVTVSASCDIGFAKCAYVSFTVPPVAR